MDLVKCEYNNSMGFYSSNGDVHLIDYWRASFTFLFFWHFVVVTELQRWLYIPVERLERSCKTNRNCSSEFISSLLD